MKKLEDNFSKQLWITKNQINELKNKGSLKETIAEMINLLLYGMSIIDNAFQELMTFKEMEAVFDVQEVVEYDYKLSEEAETFYKRGEKITKLFVKELNGVMLDIIPLKVRHNLLLLTDKMMRISARWHIERIINVFELERKDPRTRAFPQRKPLLYECIFFADRMNATKMGIHFDDGIMPKTLIFAVQPNSGKSFIVNVYSLMSSCLHAIYYSDSGILRMSNNTANAMGFSKQIKSMIENVIITTIYPEFRKYFKNNKPFILELGSSEEWKMEGLDPRIRATYFARGRDSAINGIRADVALIVDDLSDGVLQMNNDEAHQQMFSSFMGDMMSRRDNNTVPVFVIGTMFNEFDIANTLIEKENLKSPLIQDDKFPNVRHNKDYSFIVITVDCFDKNGRSVAPNLITTEELRDIQNSLKPYEFDLIYRQLRTSREPRIFDYKNLRTYDKLPKDVNANRVAVMDPTRKNGADYFSMPVFAKRESDGLSYFVDCIYEQKSLGKLNDPTNSFLKKCIKFLIDNNVKDLYIENNTNNTIGMIFDEEFKKKGHDCKIHEIYTTKIKGPKSSKNERILTQEPTIINNIVFPKAGMYPPLHRISTFMNDFTRYDSKLQTKQHDDAPDSVAMYSDKCVYVKNTRYSSISGLNKSLLWR